MEVKSVGNVSVGNVVAILGRHEKMKGFHDIISKDNALKRRIALRDVTSKYQYAPSNGLMAQSAQRGDSVEILITGKDLENMSNRVDGWDTMDGLLTKLTSFIKLDNIKPEVAIQKLGIRR